MNKSGTTTIKEQLWNDFPTDRLLNDFQIPFFSTLISKSNLQLENVMAYFHTASPATFM
jgi:hypothetical protein